MLTDRQNIPELDRQNRLVWIDVMRGAAILAVVFYHAHVQVSVSLDTDLGAITAVDEALRPFRMPMLMFLSGMLLPVSLKKSGAHYLQGKVRKIAWPYVLWSFANLVVLLAASSVREQTIGIATFLKIFYAPPTYHWYLAYLFIFYLVALFLHRLIWLQTASIFFALIGSYFVGGELRQFLYLWAFFAAGDFITRHWNHLGRYLIRPSFTLFCVVVVAPALIISAQGSDLRYDPVWAISVFAAIFALQPLARVVAHTRIGSVLVVVGRQSIVYYVVHYLVITITFHVLYRLGLGNPLVLFVTASIVALVVGTVLVRWRQYPLVGWLFEWAPSTSNRERNLSSQGSNV